MDPAHVQVPRHVLPSTFQSPSYLGRVREPKRGWPGPRRLLLHSVHHITAAGLVLPSPTGLWAFQSHFLCLGRPSPISSAWFDPCLLGHKPLYHRGPPWSPCTLPHPLPGPAAQSPSEVCDELFRLSCSHGDAHSVHNALSAPGLGVQQCGWIRKSVHESHASWCQAENQHAFSLKIPQQLTRCNLQKGKLSLGAAQWLAQGNRAG